MTQEEKAEAYDKVRKKIAIRFGSNVADEFFAEFEESKDERVRKALKQYFVNSFQNNGVAAICGVHVKDVLAWLEKQKGNIGGISPNWSEEDESILQGIWDEILANKHDAKECEWKTYDMFLNWLKSLKGRVQPKQEWSEEDSQYIDDAFTLIGFGLSTHTTGEVQEWLLSLKGRVKPQWKPSDEQMNNK